MMSRLLILCSLGLVSTQVHAVSLDEYLAQVKEKHQGLQSLQRQQEVASFKKNASDLGLTPMVSAKAEVLSDKKQPNQLGGTESQAQLYSLGYAQKFSTGTTLSVTAKSSAYENLNIAIPGYSALFGAYAQGSLGVSIVQSLWKDAFGRATELRREREAIIHDLEVTAVDIQMSQILIEAEAAYWDAMYLHQELQVRKSSLDRAQKLEAWIKRRQRDGISDQADVLNIQALVALRDLQLQQSQDEVEAIDKKLKDFLNMAPDEKLAELTGQLTQERKIELSLNASQEEVLRLDALVAKYEAKVKQQGAQEALEGTKADLSLTASYNTNSFVRPADAMRGLEESASTDMPTTYVSLNWTYLWDTTAKRSVQDQAKADALASQAKAEQKIRESKTSWTELQRRHQELSKKIKSASLLQKIQADRARAQQSKFAKGRTVTSEVVTSEQDAAEAELSVMKMQAEQRKLEAQVQMFLSAKGKI